MLLALLTAPALLGFASTPRGVADPGDGGCTDASNVVMSGITGGKTCADLAAEGRCASTDDLVKTVMEKNCMASCGACGEGRVPQRLSYSAYAASDGADGNWVLKEWAEGMPTIALDESQAALKMCGPGTAWQNGKCEGTGGGCPVCAAQPSCAQQVWEAQQSCPAQPSCAVMRDRLAMICCTRRGFEPGSRPAARLHALPAPPPAPRPAAGARRSARRATRSRAAGRRGGRGVGREGSGDAGTAVSRRFLNQ